MGFLTRLIAGLTAAAALGAGLSGTANAVDTTGVMADTTGTTKSVVKLSDDGGNETSEDTADNPDDDSTDADSTTDAGAQSDAGQQAEIQSSTSQDKATAKSSLPDHIVNGSFDYPACPDGKNSCDVDPTTGWGGFYVDYDGRKFMPIPDWDRSKFGWDSSQEGLRPDQQPNSHQKLQHCVQIGNKPNNNGQKMNRFAEIIAETPDEYIYQDIATTPGVMYRWSLKHASENASHVDSMQVMIGSPGKETAQDATRTTSNGRGDRTGVTSKTIATKGGQAEWETYTGVYIATSTVTRFTFKSAQGRDSTRGNFIDDVMFTKAYKLTYDKNSADASGQVPSNQRGKENTTQPAKTKTNGKIRLASDTSKLSDHIVNGSFDYPSVPSWTGLAGSSSNKNNKGKLFATINPGTGKYGSGCAMSTTGKAIPNWNRSSFAWSSTQGDTHYPGISCEAGNVELNYDSVHHNQFAELTADQQGTAIYQDVKVTPGTMMTWSLKHSSATSAYADKMQVMIGEPYKETAQEATRIASENGNKVGEKMTTISTPTTSDRADSKKWDTYSGTYLVPDGVTTVRFTFKSVASAEWYSGNDLDDIEFSRSYKLTYDKNSSDAAGEVPSNQRGKENTTQPAKTKTNGTVKTVADTNASLPDHLVNGDFSVNYHDQWKDSFGGWTSIDPNAGKTLHATSLPNGSSWKWTAINGWDKSKFGWTSTQKAGSNVQQKANAVELQYDDSTADNVYAELCAYEAGTAIYQDIRTTPGTLYKVRLKHASLNSTYLDKMQVMIGTPGHEQPVEMTRTSVNGHGDKLNEKSTVIATKVTNGNNRHHADQWETYEGTYLIPDGQTTTRFTFKSIDSKQLDYGNVLDDIVFDKAYRLDYDKNASDASGQVPSNETANTVKQAKAKSSGSVRLAADKTDGKVSDLVQRTTTHEDGSVTVRTVDQSTDVVSGCQVYYPAGQKITLATMAKDDDCWDSSMLSRPGHTQLGWNQDRNATQAQAQVTMVEGGMTVFAVWVGNPVLTYDTNKPSTWTGEMPSTPASVSVPYNTAAADGSGWQAGDTSKIRGYKFLGWYTAPQDNTGLYQWATPLTGNVTVYAHWQRLQSNVVYDKNASDAKGSHANTTGWQYSDVTVPSDTSKSFTRDGYVFKGWSTKPGKADVVYKDGSKVPLQDKDITLYAQWQQVFEQFNPTGGVSLPLLIAGGVTLLVMGIGSTVMLTRRMRGER
ncbi:InlB B-repeat-containing protein [Bifidobacterium adolescentis]|uniref:Cell surface protein n=1 Tax=Bifidobacterium adolescentis TaxID=1680 RepID=A0A1X2ZQG8_BIFAD|nr:InlB B-repeat-containing protein [Bifidobacterium adolescentis]OSG96642.1 cell surface protein [Bifidobacterium adolescentis]